MAGELRAEAEHVAQRCAYIGWLATLPQMAADAGMTVTELEAEVLAMQ